MGRPYKLTWHYQADEEILQSSIYYFNDATDDVDVTDLTNLTGQTITRIAAHLDLVVPTKIHNWSVTCSTPAIESVGPARWINAVGKVMPGDEAIQLMDSIVANVTLRGENAAEEAVVGGMRLSLVGNLFSDRNQLDANFVSDLEDALNIIYPATIGISTGTINRCIKSVRPPADPEYVFPVTLTVSNRVGTNLTRVGNRPQRNTGPIVAP
jgi:hypothetical protein